ncbi:hypothetical protein DPMN_118989 [Dreissena polymorpha]|uniref:Uncharacterized protein n=1 Tax=Dreissena polymorpha TaxID=45954 RepID=A0A9D4GL35_DREPO|nr:hypothetical protein DPMN_118989 [Dreissena polymorpha]
MKLAICLMLFVLVTAVAASPYYQPGRFRYGYRPFPGHGFYNYYGGHRGFPGLSGMDNDGNNGWNNGWENGWNNGWD